VRRPISDGKTDFELLLGLYMQFWVITCMEAQISGENLPISGENLPISGNSLPISGKHL